MGIDLRLVQRAMNAVERAKDTERVARVAEETKREQNWEARIEDTSRRFEDIVMAQAEKGYNPINLFNLRDNDSHYEGSDPMKGIRGHLILNSPSLVKFIDSLRKKGIDVRINPSNITIHLKH